jgi:hypothetical protein
MSSKRKRDQFQREIFDSLPAVQIYSAAGLMMHGGALACPTTRRST